LIILLAIIINAAASKSRQDLIWED